MNFAFSTARMEIKNWRHRESQAGDGFYAELLTLLTPEVTQALPNSWQSLTAETIRPWFAKRAAEGDILTLSLSDSDQLAGLLLLYPDTNVSGTVLHIGYLLGEGFQGLAKELLKGLVEHCQTLSQISELIGGVAASNMASRHLLESCGFSVQSQSQDHLFYRLTL